jgi:hypothetical protein
MRGVQASSFTPICLGCLELADDPAVAVLTFARTITEIVISRAKALRAIDKTIARPQLSCVAADLTLCRSDRNEDIRDKQQDVLHFRHSR